MSNKVRLEWSNQVKEKGHTNSSIGTRKKFTNLPNLNSLHMATGVVKVLDYNKIT